jgi:multidrug transporter EmrE-like cation transporter
MSVIVMLCGITIASFSQILLKTSANIKYDGFWQQYLNKRVIAGYLLLVVSTLFSIIAYSGMDYKFGQAFESVGLVLVTVFSCFILKEKISKKKVVGIIMIIAGILVFCI